MVTIGRDKWGGMGAAAGSCCGKTLPGARLVEEVNRGEAAGEALHGDVEGDEERLGRVHVQLQPRLRRRRRQVGVRVGDEQRQHRDDRHDRDGAADGGGLAELSGELPEEMRVPDYTHRLPLPRSLKPGRCRPRGPVAPTNSVEIS